MNIITGVQDLSVYNMIAVTSPYKGDNHESGIKFVSVRGLIGQVSRYQ